MQVARNGLGVLAVQDGGGIARLRLLHKGKLGVHVFLVKRLDLVVKRFACRDLGVRLVGDRQRDVGCRRGFPRLRLVNRALVAVERHVIGAGGVFNLVVFAVYIKRARGGHLQVIGKAVFVGNGVSAGVLHVIVREAGVHLLLQRGLLGGNLVRVALDGDIEGMGARNAGAIAAGVAEQLDGCGQRDLAVRRGARDRARVIAPAVTADLHLVAGALPFNLVLVSGAGTIRKRDLAGNGVGVVAIGIADGQLLGNVVQALLKLVLVPGNVDADRRVSGGFAVLGKGERDRCRAQAIEVVARILVRVHVEERDVAVGAVIGGGDADRRLVAGRDELDGVHLGGNALEAQLGDLRLKHAVEVGVVAVYGRRLDVFVGQLLHHRIDRIAIDDLVGEHGFHVGGTACRDNLQVLAGSCGGHGDVCAFHAFELGELPVGRIGGKPREGDAVLNLHAVDGVRIGSLGLSLGRHGIAGDEMSGGADSLRRGDHAQQVILARCRHRGARHPFDRIVQGIRRDFKRFARKRGAYGQRAVGGDAARNLLPIAIFAALGIPGIGELGVIGRVLVVIAAGNLRLRRDGATNLQDGGCHVLDLNGGKRVLTRNGNGADRIDGCGAAIIRGLLRADYRAVADGLHTDVLAHHGIGDRVRGLVGRILDILEVGIGRGLGVGVLPLIMNLISWGNLRIAADVSGGREHGAHLCRAGELDMMKRHRARFDHGAAGCLYFAETAVGASLNVLAQIGVRHRERVALRTFDLGVARGRAIAVVPGPCNARVVGNIAGCGSSACREGVADIDFAGRAFELHLGDVNGTSGSDNARGARGVFAAADLRGNDAFDAFALKRVGQRERFLRFAGNIRIGPVFRVALLPLEVQLGSVDERRRAFLLGKRPDRVAHAIDVGTGFGVGGGKESAIDVDGTGLLEGPHVTNGVTTVRNVVRTSVGGYGYVPSFQAVIDGKGAAALTLDGFPRCRV